MKKIFLTGSAGCGKSTVLIKVIELLKQKGLKVGGIVTPEKREKGKRIGFLVRDVYSGEEGWLARVCSVYDRPKLGKYSVLVEEFEKVALKALEIAFKECEYVCIDEIGKMELFSSKFKEILYKIINSDKPVIAVLHRNFVNQFKKYGEIIEVNSENRNKLPEEILEKII